MVLTTKQEAQVAKAQGQQKAALKAMFERQNQANGRRAVQRQQRQPRQQQQNNSAPATKNGKPAQAPKAALAAFDAFDRFHLPVDEYTAPYTTTNFISVMEFGTSVTMDQVVVVCPRTYHPQELYTGQLTDLIAVRYDASETIAGSIPTLSYVRSPVIDQPTQTDVLQYLSVRGRLHNLSVRLTCLGTNTGLYPPGSVYLGAVPMIETGSASTGTAEALTIKTAWADDSIAVGYIKPVSAASLQERAVTLHSAVAENVSYKSWRDFTVPKTSINFGGLPFSTALEPIVLYIPRAGAGTTVVNYRIEIGQQWCTRHPHNVMLRATQKQHKATQPSEWQRAIASVKDIGEHLLNRAGSVAVDALLDRARTAMAASVGGAIIAP